MSNGQTMCFFMCLPSVCVLATLASTLIKAVAGGGLALALQFLAKHTANIYDQITMEF